MTRIYGWRAASLGMHTHGMYDTCDLLSVLSACRIGSPEPLTHAHQHADMRQLPSGMQLNHALQPMLAMRTRW